MTESPLTSSSKFNTFISLLKLSASLVDGEALNAIRAANRLLSQFGGDWGDLLKGRVTIIADPFTSIPEPSAPKATRPPPSPPSPPGAPPRHPVFYCKYCGKNHTSRVYGLYCSSVCQINGIRQTSRRATPQPARKVQSPIDLNTTVKPTLKQRGSHGSSTLDDLIKNL